MRNGLFGTELDEGTTHPAVAWRARDRLAPGASGHGMVRFESALERDCIAFLASHDGFRRIESQPISIRFAYGGQERRYTPDFLAIFDQLPDAIAHLGFGLETYVEVKYADQAAADREPCCRMHR